MKGDAVFFFFFFFVQNIDIVFSTGEGDHFFSVFKNGVTTIISPKKKKSSVPPRVNSDRSLIEIGFLCLFDIFLTSIKLLFDI